jgi:hypothetical protein
VEVVEKAASDPAGNLIRPIYPPLAAEKIAPAGFFIESFTKPSIGVHDLFITHRYYHNQEVKQK